jgi:hypothetical protein
MIKKAVLIGALASFSWATGAFAQEGAPTGFRPGLLELAPENPANSIFSDQNQESGGTQVRCSNNSVNVCVSRKVIIDPIGGAVPEPGTLALLGSAGLILVVASKRKPKK